MAKEFSFPKVLYKAFPRREYAESFCKGQIRFSTLAYYRETGDGARSDGSEGIGEVKRNERGARPKPAKKVDRSPDGIEKIRVELPEQDGFVCCFSVAEGVDSLPARFGRFYVKVGAPERLYYDLRAAMARDPLLGENPPALEAGAVRYDKGRYVGDLVDPEEIKSLPWLQKPAFYAEENEYRIHFHCHGGILGSRDNYTLEIGSQLAYCKVFERDI